MSEAKKIEVHERLSDAFATVKSAAEDERDLELIKDEYAALFKYFKTRKTDAGQDAVVMFSLMASYAHKNPVFKQLFIVLCSRAIEQNTDG